MLGKKALSAASAAAALPIEDVFSTYLYTGNGSTQTITNGIDLAGEGGLVWLKNRGAVGHQLTDTARGPSNALFSELTSAQAGASFTSFNSNGFTLPSGVRANNSGATYASWTFRKAERFFDVVTYTGDGTSGRQISHNLDCEVGTLIIKKTNATGAWIVYHRSIGTPQYLSLNSSSQAANFSAVNTVTSTYFVSDNQNASGDTYVAYLFAHDPLGPSGDGSDGLIACGSYTGNGSSNGPEINLGWEPQWLLVKRASGGTGDWALVDTMRGWGVSTNVSLEPNSSSAESTATNIFGVRSTGFQVISADTEYNASGNTYIYIAIRRGPMREPTSGTEVLGLNTYSGTGAAQTITTTIDAPDAALSQVRNTSGWSSPIFYDRVRGKVGLFTDQTAAEIASDAYGASVLSDAQKQEIVGSFGSSSGKTYVTWSFKRAPGFFDVVAYRGTGVANTAIKHNLKAVPEMIILKDRADSQSWIVYHKDVGNSNVLVLNFISAAFDSNNFNDQNPTDTQFYLGGPNTFGNYANPNIAYLFASLPGVSKVGSYTGNGSSQTINCGFTTGARFILIKRTDSTGDWYVWDSARGIVAGNDPHLSLNTSAAEVTTDDSVDAESSGFIVNQVAATNVNVNTATYIYLAIA